MSKHLEINFNKFKLEQPEERDIKPSEREGSLCLKIKLDNLFL